MKAAAALGLVMLFTATAVAGQRHVLSDKTADFSSLKTFAILEGRATTTRPELNNKLTFKRVEDEIRAQLVAKGMKEAPDSDILVAFRIGEDRPNGPGVIFDQGTIVIEIMKRAERELIWHGVYRDSKARPDELAEKLADHVKKLLAAYPPKKK